MDHEPVFKNFNISTTQKVFIYFLDAFGCLGFLSKRKGYDKVLKTKIAIDKAR